MSMSNIWFIFCRYESFLVFQALNFALLNNCFGALISGVLKNDKNLLSLLSVHV